MSLPELETYFPPAQKSWPPRRQGSKPSSARESGGAVAPLRVCLLGGFRVERGGAVLPDSVWRRRTAKTLLKLLATHPGHALHREQVLEMLWSGAGPDSALNSLGKALYAARRALEPELPPRAASAYLRLKDEMVVLHREHVTIDADEFEELAHRGLTLGTDAALARALAAYGGELLPGDRYADWSEDRRRSLRESHIRLLLSLAEVQDGRGDHAAAVDSLRSALRTDATREDVHRQLMRLYAKLGTRQEALLQFHTCRQVLRRELDAEPGGETEALYRELLGNRAPATADPSGTGTAETERRRLRRIDGLAQTSFVGRKRILQLFHDQLGRAERGRGLVILVSGEPGVGKTRLVAQFLDEARRRGAAALETVGSRHRPGEPVQENPALAHFAPSFPNELHLAAPRAGQNGDGDLRSLDTVVQLLTDLDGTRPVIVVLGDVDEVITSDGAMLETVGRLAARRRWLVIGTVHMGDVDLVDDVHPRLEALAAEGLCLHFRLPPLERPEFDQLVQALLPGAAIDPQVIEHVHARTLGNPLLAEELVREMVAGADVMLEDHCWRLCGRVEGSGSRRRA
jgi:DNA-binding SARP family transcriptional activator